MTALLAYVSKGAIPCQYISIHTMTRRRGEHWRKPIKKESKTMFDGIIKLANLVRRVKEQMADLEALTNLLNNRIEYLNNENDELRKDNQRLRQFLSGQDE
jgi:hypothetical protein